MPTRIQKKTPRIKRTPKTPLRDARRKPRTIDDYLEGIADGRQRAALDQLRNTIRTLVPHAEECLSYGLPAFRLNGRPLVAFGAAAHHCAFYPMSSATVETYKSELKNFETSKGTIRFQPDRPLPIGLLRKLVKARMAESLAPLAAGMLC